jgi:hypothetical protein
MPTMTKRQYDAGLDKIMDRYERAGAAVVNEKLEAFKSSAVIVETAPRPAARPSASGRARRPKLNKRGRRIAKETARILAAARVRETLTAAAGPKPPPGAAAQVPAGRSSARKTTAKAPAEMSADELGAATLSSVGGQSPFWRPAAVETAAVAALTEAASAPPKPLHTMTGDELADYAKGQWAALGQAAGYASPAWAG